MIAVQKISRFRNFGSNFGTTYPYPAAPRRDRLDDLVTLPSRLGVICRPPSEKQNKYLPHGVLDFLAKTRANSYTVHILVRRID